MNTLKVQAVDLMDYETMGTSPPLFHASSTRSTTHDVCIRHSATSAPQCSSINRPCSQSNPQPDRPLRGGASHKGHFCWRKHNSAESAYVTPTRSEQISASGPPRHTGGSSGASALPHDRQGSWIDAGVTILPGLSIGEGCVIAAGGSSQTAAPRGLYAGNPATRKIDPTQSTKRNRTADDGCGI